MEKLKLGFIASHRGLFDRDWAIEMRKRTLGVFSNIREAEFVVPDGNLVKDGLVENEEDSLKVIKLFKELNINGIVLGTMTFGDEIAAISIVEKFINIPVFLFGTKEGSFTKDGSRRSDSFCGTISIAAGLNKRKILFDFGGIYFPEEKDFIDRIKSFIKVINAVKIFYGARVGIVGTRPAPFETCCINESNLIDKFKIRIIPTTVADIGMNIKNIQDNDINVGQIENDIKSKVDYSRVNKKILKNLAKLEIALINFINQEKLSCLAVQCWTAIEKIVGVVPCFILGRLTESGVPSACETDIYGALTMLIQYSASLGKSPSHFMDWTIEHQEKKNTFLSFHCGNAPISLCSPLSKPLLREHFLLGETVGVENSYGTCEFQLKEGVVSLNRLSENNCDYNLLICKGKVINERRDLRGSWSWIQVKNLEKLYRTLIEQGFTHHASIVYGDFTEELEKFCKFLNIKAVVV